VTFVIGYVGGLSPEKNVRLLAGRCLIQASMSNYNSLIVGEGSERTWLRRSMQYPDLPGVLRGLEMARAYASMDAFVFPSSTDTFWQRMLGSYSFWPYPPSLHPKAGPSIW
jgi:glycosyltransferase involved in cell wall biosynthesis